LLKQRIELRISSYNAHSFIHFPKGMNEYAHYYITSNYYRLNPRLAGGLSHRKEIASKYIYRY